MPLYSVQPPPPPPPPTLPPPTTNFKNVTEIKSIAQDQRTVAMTRLFDCEEDCDFTVKCGKRLWRLHRVILRSESEYFKKACSGKFKEGASGTIELKEDDPQYAGILLRYFYAHDYHIGNIEKPPLVAHTQVYAIADKYGVELLKDLAAAKFSIALEDTRPADISSFVAAIKGAYTSTPSLDQGLRNCVRSKLKKLSGSKQQLRDSEEFMTLIRSGLGDGEFAVDVIDAWTGLSPTGAARIPATPRVPDY